MDIDDILLAVAVMITATIVASSVAKKLSLGSIGALLVVGMALGPYSPRPLLTGHWQAALIVALGLAMSSDAVAISSLEEHAESASPRGRAVMAVVIYQGFMAIPVLAVIPLLASRSAPGGLAPTAFKALEVCTALAGVYLFARYALPKALTFAARKQGIQLFTLTIIAAVFIAAWVMDKVGLSSALGAFMVGMVLSASVFAAQSRRPSRRSKDCCSEYSSSPSGCRSISRKSPRLADHYCCTCRYCS